MNSLPSSSRTIVKMTKQNIKLFHYLILFSIYCSYVSCKHHSKKKSAPEDGNVKTKPDISIENNSNGRVETWEISDGIFMSFPTVTDRDGESVVNFSLSQPSGRSGSGGGGGHGGGGHGSGGHGGGGGHDKKLLQRILPMFIIPFLIQSAILPMFLSTLKMMLVKSLMVGKVALLLIAFNALKTSNAFKSRSEERIADLHYGYHGSGMEEYGAYMSKGGFGR